MSLARSSTGEVLVRGEALLSEVWGKGLLSRNNARKGCESVSKAEAGESRCCHGRGLRLAVSRVKAVAFSLNVRYIVIVTQSAPPRAIHTLILYYASTKAHHGIGIVL